MGKEKRAAGKGSKDFGESAGQMKQKREAFSPQAKHAQVVPEDTGGQGHEPGQKKP